ncbi:MAG: VWA domain-containing protein [Candidatus Eremiobacteraeota bacterium]|nr:VWA domain-containing protein [Candidatus Eremiobacteraeota bacterium]
MELDPIQRWRLVLGEAAEDQLGGCGGTLAQCDAALSWLYGREGEAEGRGERRSGGQEESRLRAVDWLDTVHQLFPKQTIERLERDAVERYQLEELVTDPAVLERAEPNQTLLRAVLRTKHLMNPQVLAMARKLVAEVVRQLMEKFRTSLRSAFLGSLDRRRASPVKVARNFDFRRTLVANLKHYDPSTRRLGLERPFFHSRTRRYTERWQLILLVDQSGSMLDSTIHAAVTASCLWGLPGMKVHLCAFDTNIVDLTDQITDPVETLMKVQLGGGTDIARAVEYATGLIENPRKTMVVVVSDFYEGGQVSWLVARVRALCAQGSLVLGLAALDSEANPSFDRDTAGRLVAVGAQVGAMTPGQLAEWIAEKVRR